VPYAKTMGAGRIKPRCHPQRRKPILFTEDLLDSYCSQSLVEYSENPVIRKLPKWGGGVEFLNVPALFSGYKRVQQAPGRL